jgi:hypothetical protein
LFANVYAWLIIRSGGILSWTIIGDPPCTILHKTHKTELKFRSETFIALFSTKIIKKIKRIFEPLKFFIMAIRPEFILAAIEKTIMLIDYDIHNDVEKQYEFRKQTVLADESLTKDEKLTAIELLNMKFDDDKILYNEGTKRICENCRKKCLATLYCEHCIRSYLKSNFSNWTSENDDIDNLIRNCQMETYAPDCIIEWIPYNELKNIKYLTEGGRSKIYTADWINGCYDEWDSKEKQLKRVGRWNVILKKLENVESANRSWFEEVCLKGYFL